MSQKRLAYRPLLFLAVFVGLALATGSNAQEPPPPSHRVPDPPVVTITGPGLSPEELSPEERERLIREALDNLRSHVPDLGTYQPEPLTLTANNGQIAYVGTDGHLYLMNPDGTAQRKILDDLSSIAWSPAWSHDSQHLAFAVDGSNGDRCLGKFHIDTRTYTELICGFVSIWVPEWSPQDNRIAFFGKQGAETGERAWVINADGSNLIALAPGLVQDWRPVWLDEDTVVFPGESSPQVWRLYVANLDQPNDPQPITPEYTCGTCGCSAFRVASPDVSPDGKWVAFLRPWTEAGKIGGCTGHLYVYLTDPYTSTNGLQIAEVATASSTLSLGMLKWAPDNRQVAVHAGGDGVMRLNVVDVISRTRTVIDRASPDLRALDWSPDGRWLATGYAPSGADPEVVSVDPINQTVTVLANGELPTWGTLSPITPFSISGQVTTSSGDPITGVTLLDDTGHTAVTDSNGNYTLSGSQAGTRTITPFKSGYTFSPASRKVRVPPDVTGQDFTGSGPVLALEFPWTSGVGWHFTGGPHSSLTSSVWDALDFMPCDEDRTVRAAADGQVAHADPSVGNLTIGHADKWSTFYGHLEAISVITPETPVTAGYPVATAGDRNADSVHLHFALKYNDQWAPIGNGDISISGWRVHFGTTPPSGYLERAGVRITAGGGCYQTDNVVSRYFAQDAGVSYPLVVMHGEAFQAVFPVANTGQVVWAEEDQVRLGLLSWNDAMGAEPRQSLDVGEIVALGKVRTWVIPLTAPNEPGTYWQVWRMVREDGEIGWFGEEIRMEVLVVTDQVFLPAVLKGY